MAPLILNLSTRWMWVVTFALCLRRNSPHPTEWVTGWATEPVWAFWRKVYFLFGESNNDSAIMWPLAWSLDRITLVLWNQKVHYFVYFANTPIYLTACWNRSATFLQMRLTLHVILQRKSYDPCVDCCIAKSVRERLG